MALNFGQNLFPPKGEFIKSFDFKDVIRGQSYITLYGLMASPTTITTHASYEGSDDGGNSINLSGDRGGQTFEVADDIWVERVWLYGAYVTASNDLLVSLQALSSGDPSNNFLASGVFTATSTTGFQACKMNTKIKLDNGTKYALVVQMPNSNGWNWRYDDTSPSYADGNYEDSTDSGATWNADTGKDYLFKIDGWTASPYILFPEAVSSFELTSKINPHVTSGFEKVIDIDFDMKAGVPMILEGKGLAEISCFGREETNKKLESYAIVKLRKWDGTTETEIANAGTETMGWTTTESSKARSLILDITSRTKIQKGDIIRITVEIYAESDDEGDTQYVGFHHNPNGTGLTAYLPFKGD
jgi:hypothetical protein